MTPAVARAREAGIAFTLHEYASDAKGGYGAEAVAALGLAPERVFKTLVAQLDGRELVVAVVPVSGELDLKRLAATAGAKRAAMADARAAERATGYVLGGISPLGQRQTLRTFVDRSALAFPSVYVSAGRRGLEIELAPEALRDVCEAEVADIARAGTGR